MPVLLSEASLRGGRSACCCPQSANHAVADFESTDCCDVVRRWRAKSCSTSTPATWQLHLAPGADGTSARHTWQRCLLSCKAKGTIR
mgnify:CR=1 FL=1